MNAEDLYKNLDRDDRYELESVGDKIKDGKVILFMGAAVHCPSPSDPSEQKGLYADADRPPMGSELADYFSKKLPQIEGIEKHSLSWLTQFYQVKKSRMELIEEIDKVLANKKPSPLVNALAEMNFKYIITTNYDQLFEQALLRAGKSVQNKGIYKPNKPLANGEFRLPEPTTDFANADIKTEAPFLYKIHGDIEAVFEKPENGGRKRYNEKEDAIVITDEDYIHFILRMSEKNNLNNTATNFNPIPASFTKILADPEDITVMFIGYSLMDYNLRLLFKSTLWKKDMATQLRKWSVDLWPDKSIQKVFEGYNITFIQKNAWSAIPYLYKHIFGKEMAV
jgi:hypothetical protein